MTIQVRRVMCTDFESIRERPFVEKSGFILYENGDLGMGNGEGGKGRG